MSKMSNLDLVLDEMIEAGQQMIKAATELKAIFSETAPLEKEAVPEPINEEKKEAPAPEPEVKKYTFQEVRGIMATLAGTNKKAEAKALLTKYGADRLSAVKEEDYTALVADAEVLLNG